MRTRGSHRDLKIRVMYPGSILEFIRLVRELEDSCHRTRRKATASLDRKG
jgi:hypothetical protein